MAKDNQEENKQIIQIKRSSKNVGSKKAFAYPWTNESRILKNIDRIDDETIKTINLWGPTSIEELGKILSYPPKVIFALSIGKSSIEGFGGTFGTGYIPTVDEAIEAIKKILQNAPYVSITEEEALKELEMYRSQNQQNTSEKNIEIPGAQLESNQEGQTRTRKR